MTLEVTDLNHEYADEVALNDVSFTVRSGELVGVLGPSGCGKTTLIQAIAGHLQPTAGDIYLRGENVTNVPPESRNVGVVFQQSTLYPHMTVAENVAYGLRARGIGRDTRDELVTQYLELVGLEARADAYPSTLSGGQQRRVELTRALAPEPDVLLLDEPLSALDRTLRERLRTEISRIQRETGVTTLFITHDQEEAMALADRLVVMNDGRITSIGDPREQYEAPPTPFVASFLGRSSRVIGTVQQDRPLTVSVGEEKFRIDSDGDFHVGDEVICHIRPEAASLAPQRNDTGNRGISGTIVDVMDTGRRYDVVTRLPTGDELLVECLDRPPERGTDVTVAIDPDSSAVFPRD